MTRREAEDRVWAAVEPSIDGYSNLIDSLLGTLTDDQLEAFVAQYDRDEDVDNLTT